MKINPKILNIPPYISANWSDVASLHTKLDPFGRQLLIVSLRSGSAVEVPGLNEAAIQEIFETHFKTSKEEKEAIEPFQFSVPLGKGGIPIDSFQLMMQHEPSQSKLPNLPPEVLEKIAFIAQMFGLENPAVLPPPEPHCNCPHCQILRTLGSKESEPLEEAVADEELTFRTWDIQQISEQLYTVANPLDLAEKYNVFLGDPLGCTCGQKNCDHIRAVLNT